MCSETQFTAEKKTSDYNALTFQGLSRDLRHLKACKLWKVGSFIIMHIHRVILSLLHSERSKLYRILAFLSAVGLTEKLQLTLN